MKYPKKKHALGAVYHGEEDGYVVEGSMYDDEEDEI